MLINGAYDISGTTNPLPICSSDSHTDWFLPTLTHTHNITRVGREWIRDYNNSDTMEADNINHHRMSSDILQQPVHYKKGDLELGCCNPMMLDVVESVAFMHALPWYL